MTAPWRETVAETLAEHYATGVDMGTPRQYTARGGWNVVCTCDTVIGESGDDDIEQRHNRHVADALAPTIERLLTKARAEALREFADTRGVNVGDEDDDWWRGYRQARRECVHDAADAAASIARTATQPATSPEEGR